MEKFNVDNFLGESTELISFIDENQLTYLMAGCGLGKSYFTKNVLMKKYRVLNVNFLNTVNLQNFSGTYEEGPKNAGNYDGKRNLTINVENLKHISDEAIKEIDILVVDEIQKMYQDISYRSSCGSSLEYNIERFIKAGKKVLVMTGTPISGIKFLDKFNKVVVKKNIINDSSRYIFIFKKGLTYFNISEYACDLAKKEGKVPVLLINKTWRFKIKSRLEELGLQVGMLESDEKKLDGSATKYIMTEINGNYYLPTNDYDVFISTSVLQEGINLNNVAEELVFITLVEEIKTPHQLIQFAGRARDQRKIAVVGFRSENEFNINYLHSYYENLGAVCLNDAANIEYESVISNEFNEFDDWKNYISEFTISKIKINEYEKREIRFNNSENSTNWTKIIEIIKKNKERKIVAKKLVDNVEDGFKLVEREENKVWLFTDNSVKCRQLIKAIENGLVINGTKDLDSYLLQINTVLNMVKMVENSGNLLYRRVFEKVFDGTIEDDEFNDLFKSLFNIKFMENGKPVDYKLVKENRLNHDLKKKISKPYEVFTAFPLTSKILIAKYADDGFYTFKNNINLGADLSYNPEEMFTLELEDYSGKTRKGVYKGKAKGKAVGKALNDKFELISDSSIKFKTLDEVFEYCKDKGLTKCKSLERFRKVEKSVVYKKI